MHGTRGLLGIALVIQAVTVPILGFTYSLDDTFNESVRTSYTEGWMYGTDKGPFGASKGSSYIEINGVVTVIPQGGESLAMGVKVMFYRSMTLVFNDDSNLNICPEDPLLLSKYMDVGFFTFEATPDNGKNSYVATIDAHREVNNSGLHYLYIQVCPTDIKVNTLQVQGDLTFHNPYGYLPGMEYGCLPFEFFRVLASLALGVFFSILMYRHKPNVLSVHKMIIGVVVLSAVEATSWLVAYSYMNKTARPFCCPYPGTVILAMLMMVLRQTVSRFLLLVICLGYGITRVQLEKREQVFIVALTIAFLASGILQLASSVASASHVHSGRRYVDMDPVFAIPALLTNMVYLTWIYGTLANMIKELKELNETYKLMMYKALAWTLGTFVTLFTMLTVAMIAAEGSPDQSWEWKWTWIQVVLWEMLNFCMLMAVSIIWRPSPRSAMLAYSKQLATTEMGAEEADGVEMETVEMQGPGTQHFVIGEEGDDSDDDRDYTEDGNGDGARVDKAGKIGKAYVVADFEPQRNSDLA